MKRNVYYYDYSPEAYNYIMTSKILRQSEKNLLNGIIYDTFDPSDRVMRCAWRIK